MSLSRFLELLEIGDNYHLFRICPWGLVIPLPHELVSQFSHCEISNVYFCDDGSFDIYLEVYA